MSVRAHRVKKLEYDKCSFNLWHHQELAEFLDIYEQLDDDGCGLATVGIEKIKEAIETLQLEPQVVESLKEDIAYAEKNGDDSVMYYFF